MNTVILRKIHIHQGHFNNWVSFMNKTRIEYASYTKIVNDETYKDKSLPRWRFIEKIGDTYTSRVMFGIIYFSIYLILHHLTGCY